MVMHEIEKLKRERQDIRWCLQMYSCELGELSRARKYRRLSEISSEIKELESKL